MGDVYDTLNDVNDTSDTVKFVGAVGTSSVVTETVADVDVPSLFVAVNDIVYDVPYTNPVICCVVYTPENEPETVVPYAGTALKLYVVTGCDGAVNVIVVSPFVVPETDKFVGALGTYNVVVVIVAEFDVPSVLVADSDMV